MMTKNRR